MRNNPFCPWLTNKEIKEQFDQIVKLVGEDAAYFIWDEFDGNFDQAFKEAQSVSDLMKTHTDPSIWNIEDEIESLRSTFNKMLYDISQNNITTKRAGRDVYLSNIGYLSEREARSAANQTPYKKTTKVIEDRGRWYIARITKQEYQDKLEELYNRKSYLIASNRAALGSIQDTSLQTSDPDLNNRLFEGKGVASIGSLLTRLAKDNPNHAVVIRTLSKSLSTATKSWKVILTDFISDPNIPGAHKGDAGVYFQNSNIIYINSSSRFRNKGGKADLTILHEIIHAATYHAAHENEYTRKKLERLLDSAREQISKKYNTNWESLIRRNINIYYGLSNIDEFLAELTTNSAFARELIYLQPTEKGFKHLLDQFVNWLLEVFHVNSTDNLYTQAYYQLYDIIANQQYYNELQNANFIQNAPITAEMLDQLLYSDNNRGILASPASQNIEELVSSYKRIDADIDFNEETHTYTNTKTGQVYKSVSNAKTDIGYGEQEDKLPEQAVSLGNFTKVIGTNIHLALHEMLTNTFDSQVHPELNSKVIQQLQAIVNNIRSKYNIISSEQILYDDTSGIAGTADLIVQDKKTKKVIILDFKSKARKIGDKTKYGFDFYNSSKYGKPDIEKHNCQLSIYEKLHNLMGFELDERGIVPIEYECLDDGTITSVSLSKNSRGTSLEDKGYYTIPHRSQIDLDIQRGLFADETTDPLDQIQVDRQLEIVKNILATTRNRIVNLFSRGKNTQATDLENTLSQFNSISEQEIILQYIESAFTNLKNIIQGKNGYNERLVRSKVEGSEVWNLKQLENWRDVAQSYALLNDIQSYLFDYSDILPEGTYDKIMPILDDAIRFRDILEGAYKSKGKDIWIKWITPFIKNIEGAYRVKAEKQYKQDHPGKIDQDAMKAYIDKYIEDNKTQIQLETRNFIMQQSIMAESDVNGFYRWVDTIFQSKDPIISGMAMAYDQMTQQTNETFNEKYRQLVSLTREMEQQFGTSIVSDPKRVYDYMLEETEDGVVLISDIPESFKKAYRLKVAEIDADPQYEDGYQRFRAKMKWMDDNAPIKDKKGYKEARIKAIEDYLNSLDISEDEFNYIMENENKTGKKRLSYYEMAFKGMISYKRSDDLRQIAQEVTYRFRQFDKQKFPNTKWEALQKLRQQNPNDIRVRFFDFIKELADEGDARVAPRYRLNGRLPGVRKTSVERYGAGQSLLQTAKEGIGDALSIKADDTMYGQIDLTDEQNRPVNYVPVFYTGRVSSEDQSFDIPNIYKMWFKSALSYGNTVEILDQLEYTRYIINERQTKAGGQSYASKMWKRMHPDSPIDESYSVKESSNLAHQLNDWFDMIVYGKGQDSMGTIENPLLGKIDMGKVINLFSRYASLRVMGLNYISMVNNAAQAEVAQAIETFSKRYVSPKAYTRATGEYITSLPEILGDVGARVPTSKINLLNQLFMTFADYSQGNMRLSNRFSRLFNSGAFYFTTNLGEHEAQSRFLIASLMDKRALDKDGNDIGSIYDFYTVEDGRLVFDKDGQVANWTDQDRRNLSSRVRSILMSMHGNYSEKDKVALQRNGYLKLALMFRKWIIPTWRKRFDALYYDNVLQDYKEGYYRTGGRFYANNVKKFFYKLSDETKAAEIAINADWHNLTEQEKANVRRFNTEIIITASLMILYSVVKGYADDDDDKVLDNIAYQFYRLRTDMGFYYNPRDMFKIIQSPFPSSSSIKSITNLLDQIINPLDRYERGPWKDHLKLEKRIYDMLPVVRQLYRARDIENEYNILNMK